MFSPQNIAIVVAVALPTIIPTLAVVISILRSDAKINSLRSELRADVDLLRSDLRADIRILTELGYEHHGRLAKLEIKGQP